MHNLQVQPGAAVALQVPWRPSPVRSVPQSDGIFALRLNSIPWYPAVVSRTVAPPSPPAFLQFHLKDIALPDAQLSAVIVPRDHTKLATDFHPRFWYPRRVTIRRGAPDPTRPVSWLPLISKLLAFADDESFRVPRFVRLDYPILHDSNQSV